MWSAKEENETERGKIVYPIFKTVDSILFYNFSSHWPVNDWIENALHQLLSLGREHTVGTGERNFREII